jgi:drug/metabolite transporter (DMT)-like permease
MVNKLIYPVILIFALSRGLQRILTAFLLDDYGALQITFISLLIATIIFLLIGFWKNWLVWDKSLLLNSIPLGLVNIAIPGFVFIQAQKYLSASATALFVAGMPLVIALLGYLILKESLSRKIIVGIVIGVFGIVTLTIGKGGEISGQNWWVGIFYVAIGVISASLVYVSWRGLLTNYKPVQLLAPQLIFSTIGLGIASFLLSEMITITTVALTELTLLALVNYILPQISMFYLLKNTSAVKASLPNYLAPLFATILAIPLLGQQLTPTIAIGGCLILLGAYTIKNSK